MAISFYSDVYPKVMAALHSGGGIDPAEAKDIASLNQRKRGRWTRATGGHAAINRAVAVPALLDRRPGR